MGELGVVAGDMTKAVYDANDNSRIEKDAMGITLNKLLKGAGAGADPDEIDVPAAKSISTGSYAGDNSDDRQITVGFKCSLVLIWGSTSKNAQLIPNAPARYDAAGLAGGTNLHASDGFVVYSTTDSLNDSGDTYYYWAISE